jgi:hypothetical protein
MPDGWSVRPATMADLDTVLRLQQQASVSVDCAVSLSSQMWTFLLNSPVYETLLAEREGVAHACGRIYMDDDAPYLMDLAGSEPAGLEAVLAAVTLRAPGQPITNLTRPATAGHLAHVGSMETTGEAYYARIGDPIRWLNAVRPELSRRLASSSLADQAGEAMISLYGSSIRFTYGNGEVGLFSSGPREQAPISKGGSGVPPDLVTALLVGPLGFADLATRHPDMNAGKQADLMDVLFPPMSIDVQSWVVP